MEINVRFLENLRLEALFDDFGVKTDQPIRYKGDGTAPSPFDYFLASSALCAAYFVKVYCRARDIPTEDIRISQNNIIDPSNRYQQTFNIKVELPEGISEKDREGILKAVDRCTVKKVIQQGPEFDIEIVDNLAQEAGLIYDQLPDESQKTLIPGKDAALEDTIRKLTGVIEELGIRLEIASWRNIVANVWSVHIRDAESPMCFTNGKGATRDSALCSALGEYIERLSCNYFYNEHFLGHEIAKREFVHYPNEKWFLPGPNDSLPSELMDEYLLQIYNPEGELNASHLFDTNSGNPERGICATPYVRQSDMETVYIPVNLVGNLFVSNGMSAGNSKYEARVQCLSEIFERAAKKEIIEKELALPDVPMEVLERYPSILEGIKDLESKGFPLLVKDASLGGQLPVLCITLMNPRTGGVYASFGAHPRFEVALERCLTELMQGRSFEGLNDVPQPTFNSLAVQEPNNFVEHFIDSTGIVSWKFFSDKSDFEFKDWDFVGTTQEENDFLMDILKKMDKEVYIADFEEFGTNACRILVPGYSEIYPIEDLLWDNMNKALLFRHDIMHLHDLTDDQLVELIAKFNDCGLDDHTRISELVGIEFDENTVWGQLNIGELKILTFLVLKKFEEAVELVINFLNFNENTVERQLFYQAILAVLEITLDPELELADFRKNLDRMFGKTVMDNVVDSVSGKIRFYGLPPIGLQLQDLDKHQRLVDSYLKLHRARSMVRS